ncbi:uncharacterized protein LOC113979735, partial [Neopelma chrysocephalum]|uniref:uncharacterized protein LOC113979735 n=1 Tax=Neopelma chrysocephalum TaxID=114329 RepID=UPI000FCCF399
PGRDRTQDRAHGRFRRAAQACLTSLAIRRRKTRIMPAEIMAQPDPTPSELKPDPDVGTASTDGTGNCDSAVTDDGTDSSMALPELPTEADGATTEGIADAESTPVQCLLDAPSLDVLGDGAVSAQEATEPDRGMEQRPPRVPKQAWVKEAEEESSGPAPAQQPEEVEQCQPLQEDPGRDQTQEQDRAHGGFRRAAQAFLTLLGIRRRKARIMPAEVMAQLDPTLSELKPDPDVGTASTDGTGNCDSAVTDDRTDSSTALPELTTEADGATTEGIADAESTPVQCLLDAPSLDILGDGAVSAQEAMETDRDTEQRPPRVPKQAWVAEDEEESPGPAPAQQPEEVEQCQPLQEDPGWDSGADTDSRSAQSGNESLAPDVCGEDGVSDPKQEAMETDRDTEQRPPMVPKQAWVKEGDEEESPWPAPTQQSEEVEHCKPLQEDPGWDSGADTDSRSAQSGNDSPAPDVFEENGVSDPKEEATEADSSMEQRPPSMPKQAWVKEDEDEDPGWDSDADTDSWPAQSRNESPARILKLLSHFSAIGVCVAIIIIMSHCIG